LPLFFKEGYKGTFVLLEPITEGLPNDMIITIPGKEELKVGLLKSAIFKAGLTEEQFLDLLS
jgi:hypothetical protein